MKQIILAVHMGTVELVSNPTDVEVVVRDYDLTSDEINMQDYGIDDDGAYIIFSFPPDTTPPESRNDEGWACEGCAVSSDGCPNKVKPLLQYLADYLEEIPYIFSSVVVTYKAEDLEVVIDRDILKMVLEQAFIDYRLRENVTIKIERNE